MFAAWISTYFTMVFLVFPLIFDWWLILKVASALAADATAEVVKRGGVCLPKRP